MSGRTYMLEARDKTGVFLGMSVIELVMVGGSLFCSVGFRLAGVPGFLAFIPALLGLAIARARASGRPVRDWLPLLASWAVAGATGRRDWTAPLQLLPSEQMGALPPAMRGVEIREISTGMDGRPIAAVCEPRRGRLTAVFTVRGGEFAAADPGDQDALLAGWGEVLSAFAAQGSAVAQVGWSDTSVPASLVDHGAWVGERLAAAGGAGDPDGYMQLMSEVGEAAATHQTVVWITVDGREVRDTRGRPIDRAAEHLPAAVDNLLNALDVAGLDTEGPMSAGELRRLLRARINPDDPSCQSQPTGGTLAERLGLVDAPAAGPLAVKTDWAEARIDGSYHRTWWIASWPRRAVAADWLHGFLVAGTTSRTMTVMYRPLDPVRSQRRIESQLTKLEAHEERKLSRDRRITEEDVRTKEAVKELEADLASGFAEVLYLGLISVSAPTLDALNEEGRRLEQAARWSGIDLRVLHARQDAAWAASLPFGLAEPGLLEVHGWT